jgi:acetyl esterase
MALDPQAADLIRRMAAFDEMLPPPPEDEREAVMAARDGFDKQSYELMGPAETMGSIEDLHVPRPGGEVPVRAYTPAAPLAEGQRLRPALLYLHGGGFIEGSLDSHDRLSRALSNGSGAVVVAVDYRLAPEHPFPSALEDCWTALSWLANHAGSLGADASRLAIAGDSAGGTLAAGLALRAGAAGGPPVALQVLLYPATDAAMDTPSYRELSDGWGLTREAMERSWRMYLDGHPAEDPAASPLRAEDLGAAPPALVLTCEYDLLRDDGQRYAERLREAGVPVREMQVEGMIHGYLRWRGVIDAAQGHLAEVCDAIRQALERAESAAAAPVSAP